MPGITLAQAEAMLSAAMTAYQNALSVSSYSIKDRSKSNHDIDALWNQVEKWQNVVNRLSPNRRSRTRYVVNQ